MMAAGRTWHVRGGFGWYVRAMGKPGGPGRVQLLALAAALLVFVVVQVALAGASDRSATASGSIRNQIKKLKQRVAALESERGQPATGPAGGDLAGSFPSPSLRGPEPVTLVG